MPKLKIAVIALQVLDLATTLWCFHLGGWEANPGLARVFAFAGPTMGLLIVKACLILMVLRLRSPRMLGVAASFMALVVCWNALAIATMV